MKYEQYLKLLKVRKIFAHYIPLLILFGFMLLPNSYFVMMVYSCFVLIVLYISGFWFLSKNFCPWCGNRFFGTGALSDKKLNGHLFFGKKCQHCNHPKD